ncbi:MAG TPA: class F sortase [Lapillicoccus sp.]
MSRPHWARVTAVVAAALAGGALVAYLVVPSEAPTGDAVTAGLALPSVSTTSVTIPTTGPVTPADSEPALPSLRAAPATPEAQKAAAAPTRIAVERLGIDMTVEPQGVTPDGQMALPASPEVAGWYRFGSTPDDAAGATVLAAHVDSKTGIGPFVRLGSARAGDKVDVWVGGERRAYRVTQVYRVDKTRVDGDGLFAVSGPPRLHLVTCTGAYVPGSGYTDNLVVVADRW